MNASAGTWVLVVVETWFDNQPRGVTSQVLWFDNPLEAKRAAFQINHQESDYTLRYRAITMEDQS